MRASSSLIPLVLILLSLCAFANASFPQVASIMTLAGGSSSIPCEQAQNVAVDPATGDIVAVCGNAYLSIAMDGSYDNLTLSGATCPIVESLTFGPSSTLVAGCMFGSDGTMALAVNEPQSQPWQLTNNTFITAQAAFAPNDRIILASPLAIPPTTNLSVINVARDGSDLLVLSTMDSGCSMPGIDVDYANNILWATFCNNTLMAMDPMTGDVLKRIETPYGFNRATTVTVVPSSGLLYISTPSIPPTFALAEFNPVSGEWRYLTNSSLSCAGSMAFAETEKPTFLFLQCNTQQADQPSLVVIDLQSQAHHQSHHTAHRAHKHHGAAAAATVNTPYAVLATGSTCSTGGTIVTGMAYRSMTQELILNCIEGVLSVKLQF